MDIKENAYLKTVASKVNSEIEDPERGATLEEWYEIHDDFRHKISVLFDTVAKFNPESKSISARRRDFFRNVHPGEYLGGITNTRYSTLLELSTDGGSAMVLLEVSQYSADDDVDIDPSYRYLVRDASDTDRVLMSGRAGSYKLDTMMRETAVIDHDYPRPALIPLSRLEEDLESFTVFATGAIDDMNAAAKITS